MKKIKFNKETRNVVLETDKGYQVLTPLNQNVEYDSIQWGIDGTELDVKGLEGDEYNQLMTMIYNATIEKLKIEIDEK